MSKLPSASARDVIRIAQKIGFVFDRQRGSHAVYYRPADRRRLVIPIHKNRDLKTGTLRGLIDDMGITVQEFAEMI